MAIDLSSARLGATGLYVFAFGAWFSRVMAVFGCILMIFALWRERREFVAVARGSLLAWLTLGLVGLALARTAIAAMVDPEHGMLHANDAVRIVYLAGFLPVAWFMRGEQRRIFMAFALTAAGFILARLWHFDWSLSYPQPWWQMRLGLGMEPIALGYYAASVLLGLLIFAPSLLSYARRYVHANVALTGWLLLVALSFQIMVLSQSRAVWLCMVALLPWLAVLGVRHALARKDALMGRTVTAVLLIVALLAVFNGGMIAERVATEQHTYQSLLRGEFGDISTGSLEDVNSVGTRLRMLRTGFDGWLEAPLLGHGPAATKIELQQSSNEVMRIYNDFHNAPLEILIRYGAVGFLLITLILLQVMRCGWNAWRAGQLAPQLALFLACLIVLLIASKLTNFRLLNFDWRYWMFLITGALTTFSLHPLRATLSSEAQSAGTSSSSSRLRSVPATFSTLK